MESMHSHTHDVHFVLYSHTPASSYQVDFVYAKMHLHAHGITIKMLEIKCELEHHVVATIQMKNTLSGIHMHSIARTRSQKPNACGLQLGMSHRAQSKAKQMSAHASCVFRLNRYGRHTTIHNVCESVCVMQDRRPNGHRRHNLCRFNAVGEAEDKQCNNSHSPNHCPQRMFLWMFVRSVWCGSLCIGLGLSPSAFFPCECGYSILTSTPQMQRKTVCVSVKRFTQNGSTDHLSP